MSGASKYGANQRNKTHCPQNHPYDEANTHTRVRDGYTTRSCRACIAAKARRARRNTGPVDPEKLLARLEPYKLVMESGCWEFTGQRRSGYGFLQWEGAAIGAHRLIAAAFHGLDLHDKALVARHKCDNRPCFNPDHIEPGTYADNTRDIIERAGKHLGPPPADACGQGHARAEHWRQTPKGKWYCKTCGDKRNRENYLRRKAAA